MHRNISARCSWEHRLINLSYGILQSMVGIVCVDTNGYDTLSRTKGEVSVGVGHIKLRHLYKEAFFHIID